MGEEARSAEERKEGKSSQKAKAAGVGVGGSPGHSGKLPHFLMTFVRAGGGGQS